MNQPRQGARLGAETISFRFDGTSYEARTGDTVASALLANGVRLFGRSVKARRRRGVLTAGPEEPNALVTVGTPPALIPNIPATQLAVQPGLEVRSQNNWPSLRFDLAAALQAGGGLFGAGFYYKTFMWPSWRFYEGVIRRLAGLGWAPGECNLPAPSIEHLSCDVLVAGGGPAGLLAARTAAREGLSVVLCEREPCFGGELEFETGTLEGQTASAWVPGVVAELQSLGVRLLCETAVVGASGECIMAHREPGGTPGHNTIFRIRARHFTIAMGAAERPIVFTDNDLPGVMLLGAAEKYLARYGVKVGQEVVIYANHNRSYAAAARLRAGGIQVRAVVDTRDERQLTDESVIATRNALVRSGVECLTGSVVSAATGGTVVRGARVGSRTDVSRSRIVPCDAILTSGGWSPALHAATQEGGAKKYHPEIGAFVPEGQSEARVSIGAANGVFELGALCEEAVRMHRQLSARQLSTQQTSTQQTSTRQTAARTCETLAAGDPAPHIVAFWRSPAPRSNEKRQFVDFQNDVTVADLRIAVEEGFTDIEHAKRYTALGFGTDQARIGGVAGAAILAELQGKELHEVGVSRLRTPYQPVTMRTLAGLRVGPGLRVARHTALHDWHVANGAVLESTGLWLRPLCYVRGSESPAKAALEEARHVRSHVGIADASTLGKVEISGPDAASFLDYVYMTRASSLSVGRSRYGVPLREDGMVLDDGLILRLAPDRFRVTTSTGHADLMLSQLEFYRATDWGKRSLAITDVTEAWAVIAVSGPDSRSRVLELIDGGSQPAVTALKHMEFSTARYFVRQIMILRATFSGELGYELHCPPEVALPVWESLIARGARPYGLDAMDILRIEKGYLTHAELNGQTTPYDLGMQPLMKRDDDFVGRSLLGRPAFHEESRPRLVGVRARDGKSRFLSGAQIVLPAAPSVPCGFVTSSAFSPALNEWVGLALVSRKVGEEDAIIASDPLHGLETAVRVTGTVHYDPAGQRMRQ